MKKQRPLASKRLVRVAKQGTHKNKQSKSPGVFGGNGGNGFHLGNGSVNSAHPSSRRTLPYKNPALRLEQRVKDLLGRMTLEEKAAQMMCIWQKKAEMLLDANGNLDLRKAKSHFKHGRGIGQIARPSDSGKGKNAREMAELTNAIQKFFIENSRLGIPVISTRNACTATPVLMERAFLNP